MDGDESIRLVPVNDIWEVPITSISFLPCSDGGVIQGGRQTTALVEGSDKRDAVRNLRSCLGFRKNWPKLSDEARRRIEPFSLRQGKARRVPYCKRRTQNKQGDYTCGIPMNEEGRPDPNGLNGEFGMCVLGGYDQPSSKDCPYNHAETADGFRFALSN